jgi:hypothetical protein
MKTKMLLALNTLLLVAAILLLNSCGEKEQSPSKNSANITPTLHNSMFGDITPMADGSAYATTFNSGPFASGLWYLRGNKAVRVILSETNLPEIFMFGEITPLLDGSAYVTTFGTNSILWYLHEDRAEKVSEVKSLGELGQLPKISDKAFVTLYLAEREKRKNAEADAENQKDYFPESPGDGDY